MNNKRILFIYRLSRDVKRHRHLLKKMKGQIAAFQQAGISVDYINLGNKGFYCNDELIIARNLSSSIGRLRYYYKRFFKDIIATIDFQKYNGMYIRHFSATASFIQFLQYVKNLNPTGKILLEIPTYPYDAEYTGLAQKAALLIDRRYRQSLKGLIDYVVHYGAEKSIWDIPTIPIENGVIVPPLKEKNADASGIHFIGVGNIADWWGLDRFLQAIPPELVGDRKILVTIIGEGKELERIRRLAEKSSLLVIVQFIEYKEGKELEEILRGGDIGIGTLAMDRKNLDYTSSLKHRLYAAYGIPFIYASKDKDFEGKSWAFKVSDPFRIDFYEILNWYSTLSKQENLAASIQQYALQNLTWVNKMKPVIQVFK